MKAYEVQTAFYDAAIIVNGEGQRLVTMEGQGEGPTVGRNLQRLVAFAECRTQLLDFYLAIFSALEFSNFSVMNQSPQVSGSLINFGDRRTRNAGDIGANLKSVECPKFCRFVEM